MERARGGPWIAVAVVTVAIVAFVAFLAGSLLFAGMAESGGKDPSLLAVAFIVWAFGEVVWTWWAFVRRAAGRGARRVWPATALVVAAMALTPAVENWLTDVMPARSWELTMILPLVIAIGGARLARSWIRPAIPLERTTRHVSASGSTGE